MSERILSELVTQHMLALSIAILYLTLLECLLSITYKAKEPAHENDRQIKLANDGLDSMYSASLLWGRAVITY